MHRVWNFSAGPSALPTEVLLQVQEELLDWGGTGSSIMEMSHRGKIFSNIIETAEADFRQLLQIPEGYRVLFLQGGGSQQFGQIPMNLLAGRSADYIVTGSWSKKAYQEAQRIGKVRLAATTEQPQAVASGFVRFPKREEMHLDPAAAYLHLCTNETIYGVEVHEDACLPAEVPLVADMSSHILSRPVDISRYALIYAGAQKNIGPSGLVLLIIRDDLLGYASPAMPSVMDYQIMAEHHSLLNTPPTFAIYIAGLVFKWLKGKGGLSAVQAINRAKAKLLYDAIDQSQEFYKNPVHVEDRSCMNVPFTLCRPELDSLFLQEAEQAGLTGLKGHKSVGGMRASIYNAIPLAGVEALVHFMNEFARKHS